MCHHHLKGTSVKIYYWLFPDQNTIVIINQYKSEKIILETFILNNIFSYYRFDRFKSLTHYLVISPQYWGAKEDFGTSRQYVR